jgi:16S rRNA U516 pseudouridylate synthase RsuA-like enzyme
MKLLGYGVARLIRVRIGRLMLGSLKTGEYRELTEQEAYSLASKKSSGN